MLEDELARPPKAPPKPPTGFAAWTRRFGAGLAVVDVRIDGSVAANGVRDGMDMLEDDIRYFVIRACTERFIVSVFA